MLPFEVLSMEWRQKSNVDMKNKTIREILILIFEIAFIII